MSPGAIRVGMSGFSYREWVGDFYPAGTKREDMLAHYATRFGAVEINMTFRRQLPEGAVTRWREAVGRDFRFALKAHQRITHWKKLVDTGDEVAFFVARSQGLREHLGPVLFQVPPSLEFDRAVLEPFCAALPPGGTYAFEPRHVSFTSGDADEILHRHGVARCLNDDLFEPNAYRVTGSLAYFRFHRDAYTPEEIGERAALLRSIATNGTDVYAFFQHEDNPESVRPALAMQELVAG